MNIRQDQEFHAMIVTLQASTNGSLEIKFPRQIIDQYANIGRFVVLLDGNEGTYEELSATCDYRTLLIRFPGGTHEIAFIDPYILQGQGSLKPLPPREMAIIPIHFNKQKFALNTTSTSNICSWYFSAAERKLEFTVSGGDTFMVSFPKVLLNGDFTVFIDEKKTDFQLDRNDTSNEIIVNYTSDTPHTIAIIGTTAIPEFPVGIIIASIAIGIMLSLMCSRKLM